MHAERERKRRHTHKLSDWNEISHGGHIALLRCFELHIPRGSSQTMVETFQCWQGLCPSYLSSKLVGCLSILIRWSQWLYLVDNLREFLDHSCGWTVYFSYFPALLFFIVRSLVSFSQYFLLFLLFLVTLRAFSNFVLFVQGKSCIQMDIISVSLWWWEGHNISSFKICNPFPAKLAMIHPYHPRTKSSSDK